MIGANKMNEKKKYGFNASISGQEWDEYSLERKIRLLHLIKKSNSVIAQALREPVEEIVQQEQDSKLIDIQSTFDFYYGDESE